MADPVDSDDVPVKFARTAADGTRDPMYVFIHDLTAAQWMLTPHRWPRRKSAYVERNGIKTYGALRSMTLAMYEYAHLETMNLQQCLAIRNPETYAWFALTVLLQTVFGSVAPKSMMG